MNDLVEVRMVTQMSGPRGDGSDWPPVGGTMWVPEWEARELCRQHTPANPPIAVRVSQPKVETAAPAPVAEERPGATEERAEPVRPPVMPAEYAAQAEPAEQPVKRGPGRPPGSTNKPKA